jgi:CxxC-x17-CxxC domain-containing protein
MGNFNDRRGGFKKRWDSDRRGPSMMHKATCAECGKECEVPFRPTGDRPTYCSDCFAKKRADGELPPKREFNDRPSFRGSSGGNDDMKKQINELAAKIDRLVNAVERLARGNEIKNTEEKSAEKPAPLIAKEKEVDEKAKPAKGADKKSAKTKAAAVKKPAAKKKK